MMKLIKENINFERNQDPRDAMETGIGPERYAPFFEKVLTAAEFTFEKNLEANGSWYRYEIRDENTGILMAEVLLLIEVIDKKGWTFWSSKDKKVEKTPFNILRKIINFHLQKNQENIESSKNRIEEMETELFDLKRDVSYLESREPLFKKALEMLPQQ